MQRLILMRHARAERTAPSGRDEDRELSPQGLADAMVMGRGLAGRGLRPDLALVSTAARARQTWDGAHEAFGDVEVELDPRLYNAGVAVLRAAIDAAADRCACLMIVAHNPGLPHLALDLLTESAAPASVLDRFQGSYPPAAAAVFETDAAGRCVYGGFFTPRDFGGGGE